MDIHRSRFVAYPTSAINALAFSHSTTLELGLDNISSLRLAVGRANGDIEIWNPASGSWIRETTFYGGKNRSVEGLTWTQEPDELDEEGNVLTGALRLFSIGCSNTVTEWNLESGLPLRHWSGNHSEVWCLAAQPRVERLQGKDLRKQIRQQGNFRGQDLVAGCADGTIVVLSTADNEITFQRFLSRPTAKKAKALSVTFKDRVKVVAGYADSTIRVFDLRNGNLIRNISLGAGPVGGPKETLVWAVKCLPNGDIVSGDSTGEVRFFEGRNYSQVQRISGHDADILSLVVSKDGNYVYSAGMDRRTILYTRASGGSAQGRWAKSSHSSYHEHDVKAMATFESSKLSIIASGGLDTNLVIIPILSYFTEYQRSISGLPQQPPLASATLQSLLVCWWEREVAIWRVKRIATEDKSHRLVARISLKGEENVSSASISADGSLLAVATAAEVKIFLVSRDQSEGKDAVRVRKLDRIISRGARSVQFSPDGKWLAIISHTNEIHTARMQYDTETERMESKLVSLTRINRKRTHRLVALGEYLRTINRIEFSTDSSMFVVSDLAGYIDGWVLAEEESIPKLDGTGTQDDSSSLNSDSEIDEETSFAVAGQVWKRNPATSVLPRLPSAPVVLTFRPSNARSLFDRTSNNLPFDHRLLVITSKHSIHEFSLTNGSITDWSRRNPTAVLPQRFRDLKDRTMGAFWTQGGWCWLYGANWVFGLDATANHEAEEGDKRLGPVDDPGDTVINDRKRKWGEGGAGGKIKKRDMSGLVRNDGDDFKRLNDAMNGADGDSEAEEEDDGVLLVDGLAGIAAGTGGNDEKAKWWMSLKYRPILGMLPIAQGDDGGPPEVVLVERPIWDLDLPPRFESAHKR